MQWKPEEGVRSVGHPKTRWKDQLCAFSTTLPGFEDDPQVWQTFLQCQATEEALTNDFVTFCDA